MGGWTQIPASFNARASGACDPDRMPLRVLIVDDNVSFLHAARALLESEGVSVVGVASTGLEAYAQAETLVPDVILVDIILATESGFDVARRLAEVPAASGDAAVILISTHAEADFAELIATSPAVGFLPKSELAAEPIRDILASG
jgi:two-component system, NarL family, nitrate/nitrite response regulator NarL